MNPLERASGVLRGAVESRHSDFYRNFYTGKLGQSANFPLTKEDWTRIPLLTKADILRVPFANRIYNPHVDSIRFTSGTSGSGVLSCPFSRPHPSRQQIYFGSTICTFQYQYYSHGLLRGRVNGRSQRTILADQSQLETSSCLAAESKVDSLHGQPAILIAFAYPLRKHAGLSRIRHLHVSGDRCSELQLTALRNLYPDARIRFHYTLMEAEGPVACSPEDASYGTRAVEALPEYFLELVDANGTPLEAKDAIGEIVLTMLSEGRAFPLIRYRTGDSARLISQDTMRMVFETLGRTGEERVRIIGGEIHVSELERAISEATDGEALDFEGTITEEMRGDRPIPKLSVVLVINHDGVEDSLASTAERISLQLRVNQNRSYADGVIAGLYAPIECTILDPKEISGKKRRHLTDKRI